MSYIIAFVQFSSQGDVYPVECFRTDVAVGDAVLVQLPKRQLTPAKVVEVGYLSWKCAGQIRAKMSEARQSDDGYWSLRDAPGVVGLATNKVFIAELRRRGWVPLKRKNIHMAALTNSNTTASANILVRRNGIDLHILAVKRDRLPRPFDSSQEGFREGRVVRHYFSQTGFNLYEGILRFAESFMSDEGNYDRFFNSVGSSDRRTEKLRQESEARRKSGSQRDTEDGLSDYYGMMSDGTGGSVYAGDGMWIGSGGRLHE
jgi:hypothetical protein